MPTVVVVVAVVVVVTGYGMRMAWHGLACPGMGCDWGEIGGEYFYFCEISSRFYVVTTWRQCRDPFHEKHSTRYAHLLHSPSPHSISVVRTGQSEPGARARTGLSKPSTCTCWHPSSWSGTSKTETKTETETETQPACSGEMEMEQMFSSSGASQSVSV